MVSLYTGEYPDFSTYPVLSAIEANFDNIIHQQQNGQSTVLDPGAPTISYAGQVPNNSSYPGSQFQPNPDHPKDMMISRQAWEDAVSETRQAKRERDELRLQVASLRNDLYTSRQVQKQLRIERDEAQVAAKSLKKQTTTLAETHKRLRKERNEARIRAAMLSKAFPNDVTITGRNQDPLALLLGQRDTRADASMMYETSRMENSNGQDVTRWEETRHRRPRVDQRHGEGEEVIQDSPEEQIDGQPLGQIDQDQQLIDAFLAETGSPEDLSPEYTGFSPRTMAELFPRADS